MQSLKKRVVVEVRLSMGGHFDEAGRHDTHGVIIIVVKAHILLGMLWSLVAPHDTRRTESAIGQ